MAEPNSNTSFKAPFSPMPGAPGNVIDRVAHQSEQIDDLVRRHSELIRHPRLVAPFDRRTATFRFTFCEFCRIATIVGSLTSWT
jgi:hypothetical protein